MKPSKKNRGKQRIQKSKTKKEEKEEEVDFDMTSFLSEFENKDKCKRHGIQKQHGIPKKQYRKIQNLVNSAINNFMLDARKGEFLCTGQRPTIPAGPTNRENLGPALENLYDKFPQVFTDSLAATCLIEQMISHGTNILHNGTKTDDWFFAETLVLGVDYFEGVLSVPDFHELDWGSVLKDFYNGFLTKTESKDFVIRFFAKRIKCDCLKSQMLECDERTQQQEQHITSLLSRYQFSKECKHGIQDPSPPELQDFVTRAAKRFMMFADDFRIPAKQDIVNHPKVTETLLREFPQLFEEEKAVLCLKEKMIVHGTNVLIAKDSGPEDWYFAGAFALGVKYLESFAARNGNIGVLRINTEDVKSLGDVVQFFAKRIKCDCLKSSLLEYERLQQELQIKNASSASQQLLQHEHQATATATTTTAPPQVKHITAQQPRHQQQQQTKMASPTPFCFGAMNQQQQQTKTASPTPFCFGATNQQQQQTKTASPTPFCFATMNQQQQQTNTASLTPFCFTATNQQQTKTARRPTFQITATSQQQQQQQQQEQQQQKKQTKKSCCKMTFIMANEEERAYQHMGNDILPSHCSHNIPEPPPHIMSMFDQDQSNIHNILSSHCSHNIPEPPTRIMSMFYQNVSNIFVRATKYFILVINLQYNGNVEQAFEAMQRSYPLLFQHKDGVSSLKDCMVYEATNRILDNNTRNGYSDYTIPRHLAMGVAMLEDHIEDDKTYTKDYLTSREIIQFFARRINCDCLGPILARRNALASQQQYFQFQTQKQEVTSANDINEIKKQLEDAVDNARSCDEALSYAYMNYIDSKDFGNPSDADKDYSDYQASCKSKERAYTKFEDLNKIKFEGKTSFLNRILDLAPAKLLQDTVARPPQRVPQQQQATAQPPPAVGTPPHYNECSHSHLLDRPYDVIVTRACERYLFAANMHGSTTVSAINDVRRYFPKLFEDDEQCSQLKALMLSLGTQLLLCNHTRTAKHHAVAILALEHIFVGPDISKSKYHEQCRDIYGDGERGVTSFFAERTSCTCLEEMYNKVKDQRKMGQCLRCKKQMKFKKLKECARCGIDHYCSKACQKSHWPEHKYFCDLVKAEKGKIEKNPC